MDNYSGRRKKDDKAKEKYERNPYSQKHIRLAEAAAAKSAPTSAGGQKKLK